MVKISCFISINFNTFTFITLANIIPTNIVLRQICIGLQWRQPYRILRIAGGIVHLVFGQNLHLWDQMDNTACKLKM